MPKTAGFRGQGFTPAWSREGQRVSNLPRQLRVVVSPCKACGAVGGEGGGGRCGEVVCLKKKKKKYGKDMVEVAEVVVAGMMVKPILQKLSRAMAAEKKIKTLRKFSPCICYQQDLIGNTVSIRATKRPRIHVWAPPRVDWAWPESQALFWKSSYFFRALKHPPGGISSQPWQSRRWSAPCCDLSKIARQTSAKTEHCLPMPFKKKKSVPARIVYTTNKITWMNRKTFCQC